MDLKDYLEILSRRKQIVFITALVSLIAVAIAVTFIAPTYTATATLRILTAATGSAEFVDYNITYADRLIGTFLEIAQGRPIQDELRAKVSPLPKIELENLNATELVEIRATDPDPHVARFTANTLANILVERSAELYAGTATTFTVTVVEPAITPSTPSSPNDLILVVVGLVAGLAAGMGLAFLVENLDTRLYTGSQIEALTGARILGDIPESLRSMEDSHSFFRNPIHIEAFRRLRTNIFSPAENQDITTLLVASAVSSDGRSSVVANLALSTSLTNRRVVVVDADLRTPSLHEFYSLTNEIGLSTVLSGEARVDEALIETSFENIMLLPAGPTPTNPAELLASPRMAMVSRELSELSDIVFIDSAASYTVTDPAILAPISDGVLIVVRQGWVRDEPLLSTFSQLDNVNANILGVVLNRTSRGVRAQKDQQAELPTFAVAQDQADAS